jgi:anaerobic magnesium-protoporphyrin IX monomethyl ester cyclase
VDIADALQGKIQEKDIPGIYYRKNHEIHQGRPVELINNIDEIPFPARHLISKYPYGKVGRHFFHKPPLTSMVTTRGCPYRCRYCIRHITSYQLFRQRSAANVLDELQQIHEQGYASVMIADDTFLADQQRASTIMEGLIEMGSPMEILIAGTRADVINKALYQKMKQAGVKYISFGIESGNQDVLDFYKKQVTLEQIQQAVHLSNDMGFFIHGTFILGAPMEAPAHIANTVKFACSLPLDTVTFYPLMYRHGSDLWKEAYAKQKIKGDVYETYADKEHNLSPLTKKELLRYCLGATQRFYYRPGYLMHLLKKALRTHDLRMIQSAVKNIIP